MGLCFKIVFFKTTVPSLLVYLRLTICNSYPNAPSILQKFFNDGLFSFFSILDITCCLLPVNSAGFSCISAFTIFPIKM